MPRLIFLTVILITTTLPLKAFDDPKPFSVVKVHSIGTSGEDDASDILATNDGGALVVGRTKKGRFKSEDLLVVKLDKHGNVLWGKSYGGPERDAATKVISGKDGSYIVIGFTYSKGSGNSDIWILKLDNHGNKLWDKTYGGVEMDTASGIVDTPDGGYMLLGQTASKGEGERALWLIKLDKDGTLIWDRTLGDSNLNAAVDIISASKGGYLVLGNVMYNGTANMDFHVIKMDAQGETHWERTFGGTNTEMAKAVRLAADGSFIVVGETRSKGAGGRDIWAINLSADGSLLFDITYGGKESEGVSDVLTTPDGGFLLVGDSFGSPYSSQDTFALKL